MLSKGGAQKALGFACVVELEKVMGGSAWARLGGSWSSGGTSWTRFL